MNEFLEIASIIVDDVEFLKEGYRNWGWELPLSLKITIGGLAQNGLPIFGDWLFTWFMCYYERRLRTPATRCEPEFSALFKQKFAARYPHGLSLPKPRAQLKCTYRAASGEFGGDIPVTTHGKAIPDISGVREPMKIAQEIADKAMDELDKFSRYLGRNPNGRGSIEAQALLPAELLMSWTALHPAG